MGAEFGQPVYYDGRIDRFLKLNPATGTFENPALSWKKPRVEMETRVPSLIPPARAVFEAATSSTGQHPTLVPKSVKLQPPPTFDGNKRKL